VEKFLTNLDDVIQSYQAL